MTGFGLELGSLGLGLGDSIWPLIVLVVAMTAIGIAGSGAVAVTASRPAAAPPLLPVQSAKPWVVITAVCTASAVVWIPFAAIMGGLPAIGEGVGASQSELQWIADIYPLVVTALLLPAGTLLDRFGRRRGMLLGLAVLSAGLLWCAYASSPESLLVARVVCAAASAVIFPATLATLTGSLPPSYRDHAVSIWAGTITIGSALGLIGAVALLKVAWWGSMFVGMAIITALGWVLVAVAVPETKEPGHQRFDALGAALGVLGPGGLVLGLSEGPVHGWTDPLTVGALLVGVTALVGFLWWGIRCPYALLNARVFRDRRVLGSSLALVIIFVIDFGMFFLYFQFRAYGFGETPLRTASVMMVAAVAFAPAIVLGVPVAARWGLRVLTVITLGMCAAGVAILSTVDRDTSNLWLITGLVLFWAGVGGMMTPATQGILKSLPAKDQGVASAVNDIVREFGGAIGVALFGSLFYAGYRADVADLADSAASPQLADSILSSPGSGLAELASSGASAEQLRAVQDGVFAGWQLTLWVGVGLLAVSALIICACFPKHVRPARTPDSSTPDPTIREAWSDDDAGATAEAGRLGRAGDGGAGPDRRGPDRADDSAAESVEVAG